MADKILVVGGGGREHALAWKLARDSSGPRVYCAPGNAGTEALGVNVPISAEDVEALVAWAQRERPALTVIGPEAPLCAGLTDRLQALGLRVFGPGAAAAALEGSKVFAKTIMAEGGVPTAEARRFDDAEAACAYIRAKGAPIVVKADGLAAGKGVTVAATVEEAESAVHEALEAKRFGAAGACIVVEECLQGEEASILALVDGEHIVPLASSQDHKRAGEGDRGPNTGGMGAYSPAPVVTDDLWPIIMDQVLEPTLRALKARGIDYKGVLYAGLMLTADGPKVLEFNVRFGDPEIQAVLLRWDGDLRPALEACIDGTLHPGLVRWKPAHAVCVVMAAGGYPGAYRKGDPIGGLADAATLDGVEVFHAGTRPANGQVLTAGGRVLGVTALGTTLQAAVARAYEAVDLIQFADGYCRRDIAHRAL